MVAASSDHYFPAGVYYDIALSGGSDKGPHFTHVAALRVDVDCTVYISEKEKVLKTYKLARDLSAVEIVPSSR